jgi:hypothetical protein
MPVFLFHSCRKPHHSPINFQGMTFAEFKKKWSRYTGKESSAYQEHFNDLCRLLGQPTPVEADPSGTESFCFQKRVVKDAELFEIHETPDASEPTERGFADVWKAELNAAKHYAHIVLREETPPRTPAEHRAAVAAAAQELNELRERWLNPPEWTVEKVLEFPGSADGPWARYVVKPDKNGIGTVRYPRLEPKNADCAAKLKERTLTKLYNERPAWLDLAHKKLDATVAAAYGFPTDLTDEQILEKLRPESCPRCRRSKSCQSEAAKNHPRQARR